MTDTSELNNESIEGYPIDRFGHLRDNDVRARIDAFFIKLENDSSLTRGFVIQYGSPKDNRKREELIKEFIKFRKYDVNRIVFLYKGEEGTIRTRLWLVPEGSDASNID